MHVIKKEVNHQILGHRIDAVGFIPMAKGIQAIKTSLSLRTLSS